MSDYLNQSSNPEDEDDDDVLEYLVKSGAISADVAENARRRKRYEALSDARYAEGKMVSGHYVKPSLGQNLATLGQNLAGAYGQYKADKRDRELQAQRADALQALIERSKKRARKPSQGPVMLSEDDDEGDY